MLLSKEPYVTMIGAWGDILCALGNLSVLRQNGVPSVKVIYYGFDESIKEFIAAQDGVSEVIHAVPPDWETYKEICLIACCTENSKPKDWVPKILPDLDEGLIFQTHVNSFLQRTAPEICIRGFDVRVPVEHPGFDRPTILFQPYSTQSSPRTLHWQHWDESLHWLLNNFDYQIVVCGLARSQEGHIDKDFCFPELNNHPNLINMVGKTQSIMEVFAIANKVDKIITTNNCLSIWSILNKKGALVMHKSAVYPYYFNWINYPPNKVMPHSTTWEEFKGAVSDYLNS